MEEFEKLLFVVRCSDLIANDKLLMHKCIVARNVIRCSESEAIIEALPKGQDYDEPRVKAQLDLVNYTREHETAQESLDLYYKQLLDSLKVFGRLPLHLLDQIGMTTIIAHCWLLTYNPYIHNTVKTAGLFFNVLYCLEVVFRALAIGGFRDPRGQAYAAQNLVGLVASPLGLLGALMVLLNLDPSFRFWQALSVLPLYKCLVMQAQFRQIIGSLLTGLGKIGTFCILLGIVFYVCCVLAHLAFKDLEPTGFFSNEKNFTTLGNTCLTMYQIFLGASWSGIMDAAVRQTYQAYTYFFICYRLIVGVLFSQLIVGILIGVFQQVEADRQTIVGEVKLVFEPMAQVLLPAQQTKLQSELGIIAKELLEARQRPNHQRHQHPATRGTNTDGVHGRERKSIVAMKMQTDRNQHVPTTDNPLYVTPEKITQADQKKEQDAQTKLQTESQNANLVDEEFPCAVVI